MNLEHVSIVPRDEEHLMALHAELVAMGANDYHADDRGGFLGVYKRRLAVAIGVDYANDIVGYMIKHPDRDRITEEQFFLDVAEKLQ